MDVCIEAECWLSFIGKSLTHVISKCAVIKMQMLYVVSWFVSYS